MILPTLACDMLRSRFPLRGASMRGFDRSCWFRLHLAAALLAALGSGRTCWSQVVDVEVEEEAEN